MEDKDIIAIFYSFLLVSGPCYAFMETTMPNEYMICKPVAGVFGTLGDGKNGSGLMPVLQGPEGSIGPPGKTGLTGPRGQPDYAKVAKIVEDRLQSINARLYTIEANVKDIASGGGVVSSGTDRPVPTKSPEEKRIEKECMEKYKSPISEGTMCYKLIGGEGLLWNFEHAESNCTKLGGYLADLNSRALYDKIYDYIDKTYSTVVQAWTGMRYEKNKLLLRNKKEAIYSKWSSGYPRKSTTSYYASYKYVYIYIDTSAYVRKLSNTGGHTKQAYAICSFDTAANATTTTATSDTTTLSP